MTLQTDHLDRCLHTLEKALDRLKADPTSADYDIYRAAVIKEFELSLETSGKLLRKALRGFGADERSVDDLYFKDVFREAARRELLTVHSLERWFMYRDMRNEVAHDYGVALTGKVLETLPLFIEDARALSSTLATRFATNGHEA